MLPRRSRTSSTNLFNKLGKRTRSAFPLFLLVLFALLAYKLFTVHKIECYYNSGQCSTEVLEKISKCLGSNILFLNQKELTSSIRSAFPVEKISLGFKMFNTLVVKMEGSLSSINTQMTLVQTLPELSMDKTPVSSDSASFTRPTEEIGHLNQSIDYANFEIWGNGQMVPIASSESKIKYLFTSKPNKETLVSVYSLIKLSEKYLNVEQYWILDHRVFLRQANQPDIIVDIPFDEEGLVQALQSIAYLATIKKDAKVIDLRFKNPILR